MLEEQQMHDRETFESRFCSIKKKKRKEVGSHNREMPRNGCPEACSRFRLKKKKKKRDCATPWKTNASGIKTHLCDLNCQDSESFASHPKLKRHMTHLLKRTQLVETHPKTVLEASAYDSLRRQILQVVFPASDVFWGTPAPPRAVPARSNFV